MASARTARAEAILGVYDLVRPLGEGGMAQVFLGRHRPTGRPVVIKRMHAHLADDATTRQTFLSEVHILRRFRHPCAVALLDAEVEDHCVPCIILEYVPGVSVQDLLKRDGRMPPARVGRLLGQLCAALQAFHDRGLRHGDLSPANLMVTHAGGPHETLKLIDFGLAHAGGLRLSLDRLQGHDSIGGGTPDYLSPEQALGEPVDHRGDLYAVGVILYQLLAGRVPFEHVTAVEEIILAQVQHAVPPFAEVGVTDVPEAIEDVVRACLAKFPAERPASARALAEAYQTALGEPIIDERLFAAEDAANEPAYDPAAVLDKFEAWMPESVALMKLRGFVAGVGGEVAESLPGVITVRLLDPADAPAPPRRGLMGWLTSAPAPPPRFLLVELHLAKKESSGRSVVEIAVVRQARGDETHAQAAERQQFCATICRELRAYLMIGR